MTRNTAIRNIAIIAHVDHGKTTLVDAMFRQSGIFRAGQAVDERIMDSMDLERERGITIAAKNCSVIWRDVKINVIDTPGHADFGGEVERALSMADGALLLVDASEGPLPQTRFVLKKTLEAGLKIIVVINKIDRKDARPDEVLDEIYDLFIDLDGTEDQLEFPLLYAIGRDGVAQRSLSEKGENIHVLMDTILEEIPGPAVLPDAPFQMLVSDLGYSDFLGRLAIGKVFNGAVAEKDELICIDEAQNANRLKITKLRTYDGLKLADAPLVNAGDIAVLAGIEDVRIGDTICHKSAPRALKRVSVDEPVISMRFMPNTSPLVGKEGKIVQGSKIRERLHKESLRNVSIRIEETGERDVMLVKGRGEFQMAILIETMRREGFELCVGRPQVIYKKENGGLMEPIENLSCDFDEHFLGVVTEKLSTRKGRMLNLFNNGNGRVRAQFSVPSRSLIGYRDEYLTDTKGTGIMNSILAGYEKFRGEFPTRFTGSLISDRQGTAVAYALFHLEPRGELFITPGDPVYEGMIIGEYNKEVDLNVNPCKEKKLTNIRASGKDDSIILTPVRPMTLERAIHFIREDEIIEVTPQSIRLKKSGKSSLHRRNLKNH